MKIPLLRCHAAIAAAVAGTLSAAALAAPYVAAARPSSLTDRVLLPRDVPHAKRLPYPAKEIGLRTLLQIADDSAAARKADTQVMTKAGFKRSAIAGYAGPGRRYWESGAIELGSPAQARDVLAAEGEAVLTEAPKGITTTVAPDHAFVHASVVTFTPPAGNARALGGYEIFVASGHFFYYLVSLDKPGRVSRHDLEAKLKRIMRRG